MKIIKYFLKGLPVLAFIIVLCIGIMGFFFWSGYATTQAFVHGRYTPLTIELIVIFVILCIGIGYGRMNNTEDPW